MKIAHFEKKIGYIFKDAGLLKKALTHSSYAYENPAENTGDNELLEFLGDSVVGLAIADFFYTAYPGLSEGELSKFKSTAASTLSLSKFAADIKIDKVILLGKGEEKSGGRKKKTILAGAFEAVVGAVYLDADFETAKAFIAKRLSSSFKPIRENFLINNSKSALQEMFQKSNLPSPTYRTLTEKGPDHMKIFIVEVRWKDKSLAKAKGYSKKSAEQRAARKALHTLLGRKLSSLAPEALTAKKYLPLC